MYCFSRYQGPNLVLKYNRAENRLMNIAIDDNNSPFYALRDTAGNAIGVTACDVDGDGREEIYFLNTNNAYSGKGCTTRMLVSNLTHLKTLSPLMSLLLDFFLWTEAQHVAYKCIKKFTCSFVSHRTECNHLTRMHSLVYAPVDLCDPCDPCAQY